MQAMKAHVRNGTVVLDEPTDLPEGTEVIVMVAEAEPDDSERAEILAAIERSMDQVQAGKHVDADGVIACLLARG